MFSLQFLKGVPSHWRLRFRVMSVWTIIPRSFGCFQSSCLSLTAPGAAVCRSLLPSQFVSNYFLCLKQIYQNLLIPVQNWWLAYLFLGYVIYIYFKSGRQNRLELLEFFTILCTPIVGWHSGGVANAVASQREGSVFKCRPSVWSLHDLPVPVWVLSVYSGFFPQSKDMHIRLIGSSKLAMDV